MKIEDEHARQVTLAGAKALGQVRAQFEEQGGCTAGAQ